MNAQTDNTSKTLENALSPEVRILLKNVTGVQGSGELLKLPSIYNFLPHLLESPSSLRLGFQLSKGRNGGKEVMTFDDGLTTREVDALNLFFFFCFVSVSFVLGIPSVKREYQTYLMATLRNLVDGMNPKERNDSLIVVMVAETDMDYVIHVANQIQVQ